MKFHSAMCQVCRHYKFKPEEVIAYRLRSEGPEAVPLEGKEPWSGVFVVCRDCVMFLRSEAVLTRNAPDPPPLVEREPVLITRIAYPESNRPVDSGGRLTYEQWANGGGPNECRHGIAAGIECPECKSADG
jgi:hypothetical protein